MFLLEQYNQGQMAQIERDQTELYNLLDGLGGSYAERVYHASYCPKDCDKPDLSEWSETKRTFARRIELIRASGGGVSPIRLAAVTDAAILSDIFGFVLFKHYGDSQLGAYAQMSVPEMLLLLEQLYIDDIKQN